jgi:hypothetical protein
MDCKLCKRRYSCPNCGSHLANEVMRCGGISVKLPVRMVCLGCVIIILDLLKLTSWSSVRILPKAADLTQYYLQNTHAVGHRNLNYLELFRQINIWGRYRLQVKLKCWRKLLM